MTILQPYVDWSAVSAEKAHGLREIFSKSVDGENVDGLLAAVLR